MKLVLCIGLMLSHVDASEKVMLYLNSRTYGALEALSRTEKYSKIRPEKLSECKDKAVSRCTLWSCMFRGRSIFDEEAIDLLEAEEAFTGHSTDSAQLWENIRAQAKGDEMLLMLISGIQYSITVHLSSFHKKILGFYFSNPLLFRKKDREIHRLNLYLTYIFVKRCVGSIEIGEMEEERRLSRAIGSGRNEVSDVPSVVEKLQRMIDLLGCLDCERCRLWGMIQFRGLKAGFKALEGGTELSDADKVYLVNLLMRLSVGMVESSRLRNCRMPYLRLVPLNWAKIMGCVICYSLCRKVGVKKLLRLKK
jgi:ERO1-like protein alpha